MSPIIECRIAKTVADTSNSTHLISSERARLAAYFDEDLVESNMLRCHRQVVGRRRPSRTPAMDHANKQQGKVYPSKSTAGSDSTGAADAASMNAFLTMLHQHNRPSDTMTVVKVSYDLTSAPAPADPEEFLKEQEQLKRSNTPFVRAPLIR